MAYDIDYTYFKGALSIPNIGKDSQAFIDSYITPYSKEVQTRLLGNTLYQEVQTNYDSGVDDVWRDLVQGKTYDVIINGLTYSVKWNGLINAEKISLIAYYVYFNYIQQNYQQATGLGIIQSNTENGTIVSPNQKLVWSNNECSKLAGSYPYPSLGDVSLLTLEPSLFYYLANHLTDYPNWVYNPVNEINVLGI